MAYIDKYGVEYTDDKETLVRCPIDYEGEYIIPDNVREIKDRAFESCRGLTFIHLPANLNSIEIAVFIGCSNLRKVEIPNTVCYINTDAFRECYSLEEVSFYESNKEYGIPLYDIGKCAFSGCESLKRFDVPQGVTTIGVCAFARCDSLSYLSLPSSIEEIGAGAIECGELCANPRIVANLKEIVVPIGEKERFIKMFGEYGNELSSIIMEC